MSLYVILITQGVSPKCLSPPKNGIKTHDDVGKICQSYRGSLHSWSGNEVCVLNALLQMEQGGSFSQLYRGRYIAIRKPISPHKRSWKRPNKGVLLPMVLDNDEV